MYEISASLYVTASDVVIRGEGDGGGDTVIYRLQDYDTQDAGDWDDIAYREGVLTFEGVGGDTKYNHVVNGTTSNITDDYVPVGVDYWPFMTDGFGFSLSRRDPNAYGNDVANWKGALPSPGIANP